jgi:hypothetical protein
MWDALRADDAEVIEVTISPVIQNNQNPEQTRT